MSSNTNKRGGIRRSTRFAAKEAVEEGMEVLVLPSSKRQRLAAGVKDAGAVVRAEAAEQGGQLGKSAAFVCKGKEDDPVVGDAGAPAVDGDGAVDATLPKRVRAPAVKHNGAGSFAAAKPGPTRDLEAQLQAVGHAAVGGADEAGRGPLAGPVVAAVVVLPPRSDTSWQPPAGLNDSKVMSEEEREAVYAALTTDPRVKWAVSVVDHMQIDRINILQAALSAMRDSAVQVQQQEGGRLDFLLVDGNRLPRELPCAARAVVKGDGSVSCIAAASCIAKVTRDRLMVALHVQFPQYGFAQHKGYGVPAHMAAIHRHGPCEVHRRSFEPVKGMTGWSREAMLVDEAKQAGGKVDEEGEHAEAGSAKAAAANAKSAAKATAAVGSGRSLGRGAQTVGVEASEVKVKKEEAEVVQEEYKVGATLAPASRMGGRGRAVKEEAQEEERMEQQKAPVASTVLGARKSRGAAQRSTGTAAMAAAQEASAAEEEGELSIGGRRGRGGRKRAAVQSTAAAPPAMTGAGGRRSTRNVKLTA